MISTFMCAPTLRKYACAPSCSSVCYCHRTAANITFTNFGPKIMASAGESMEQEQKQRTSRDLLSCGSGGGFHEKLLLKSKETKSSTTLQTTRLPRSNVLDRLQVFLPQIAQANEKLKEELETSSAEQFDIENVEKCDKVIEMNVAVVDVGESDSDSEDDTSDDDCSDSESETEGEITETNLKLPGCERKVKVDIEVLHEDSD